MADRDKSTAPKRRYPPFYERVVPIALVAIGITIVVLLVIILGVALDLFPAAG